MFVAPALTYFRDIHQTGEPSTPLKHIFIDDGGALWQMSVFGMGWLGRMKIGSDV